MTPTTASDVGSSAPITAGGVSTSTDPAACGQVPVTAADLADAQFAFIGRVSAIADEVHPWTTDLENPDRRDEATATRWVTFDVERWYLNDWGLSFSVWVPEISVSVGQRLAVGGNAYFTQVAGFAGQSGEVEFCAPLEAAATTVPVWDQQFGEARAPSSTVMPTTIVLPATKVFGEHDGPCEPTVLTNGDDDQSILVAGVACFLAEFEAGRPLVWDLTHPDRRGVISGSADPRHLRRRTRIQALACAGSRDTQPLRAALDEDVLVVADAVLDGVNQTVGHSPPCRLVEGDRTEVLDPCMQLEVRVAAGRDHRLALREQATTEAHALVVWLDEQVDEVVAADREVPNRHAIDDCDPSLELGLRLEPVAQLLPGAFSVRGHELASEQL